MLEIYDNYNYNPYDIVILVNVDHNEKKFHLASTRENKLDRLLEKNYMELMRVKTRSEATGKIAFFNIMYKALGYTFNKDLRQWYYKSKQEKYKKEETA